MNILIWLVYLLAGLIGLALVWDAFATIGEALRDDPPDDL